MSVFRSFFGRIHDPLIYFQDLVTFSNKTEKPLSRTLPEKLNFTLGLTPVPGTHLFLGTQNHAKEGHNWKGYINKEMPKMATPRMATLGRATPGKSTPRKATPRKAMPGKPSLGKLIMGRPHTRRPILDKLRTFYKKTIRCNSITDF